MENIEIDELSDSDLEGASGGLQEGSTCCSTTSGGCSNPKSPAEPAPSGPILV